MKIAKICNKEDLGSIITQAQIVDFLHVHLDRFRDDKVSISKAIDYAFSDEAGKGGFLLLAYDEEKLVGALVMNKTGMDGYIPPYILVYIAVDAAQRGKGIGAAIMSSAFETADGAIALHVEYDNPAKRLYERLGFTTKYAEMRYNKG
jgi:GNAT superfamily N-acetyltransferase